MEFYDQEDYAIRIFTVQNVTMVLRFERDLRYDKTLFAGRISDTLTTIFATNALQDRPSIYSDNIVRQRTVVT